MRLRTRIVLICTMAMLLNGCETNTAVEYCAIARPIYISPEDKLTDQTARAILDHDDIGRKECGWKQHGPKIR